MTSPPTHSDPRGRVVDAIRALRPGLGEVDEHASLADLGLDSLDRVALAVAVERSTGVALPDLVLTSVRTVAELIAHLSTDHGATTASITAPDTDEGAGEGGWVEDGAHVGPGTRLWHQAQIVAGATVGRDCTLGKGAYVGAGSRIGDLVKIGNYAGVFGARIADRVMICPAALLLEDPAPRATTPDGRRKQSNDFIRLPVTIGHGATIGAGAVIAPGVRVGAHALVALGAVVVRDVAAHALVAGNPARHCGWVCTCGHTLNDQLRCPGCRSAYTPDSDSLKAPGLSCCDSIPEP
jgi:acetyltransferase-like isoleucine patch superfamily enzyme/acyl carrier protein